MHEILPRSNALFAATMIALSTFVLNPSAHKARAQDASIPDAHQDEQSVSQEQIMELVDSQNRIIEQQQDTIKKHKQALDEQILANQSLVLTASERDKKLSELEAEVLRLTDHEREHSAALQYNERADMSSSNREIENLKMRLERLEEGYKSVQLELERHHEEAGLLSDSTADDQSTHNSIGVMSDKIEDLNQGTSYLPLFAKADVFPVKILQLTQTPPLLTVVPKVPRNKIAALPVLVPLPPSRRVPLSTKPTANKLHRPI